MALDMLLGQVKNAVMNHADAQQHTGFDPSGLLNQIEGLFGQHAANNPQTQPSGMDPYGEPTDQPGGRFANVRPASEDPLGDPADARSR